MKISCQSCAAKYTIADDKVLGKVIKIKCKKCGSTIVVNGNDPAVLAQLQAGGGMAADAAGFDDQAATKLLDQSPFAAGMGAGPDPNEWTVSVTDDDQRTMTTAQIAEEYARGGLGAETFVWREGMGDWIPLTQVPEIMALVQGGAPAAAPAADVGYAAAGAAVGAAVGAAAYGGQEATAVAPMAAAAPVAAAPLAAAAPTAARKAAARPAGGDLFGGGGGAGVAAASSVPQHVGERNETSVLFSLKDLVAAEASASTGAPKKAPSSKGGAFGGSNDRVDDILSMGSVGAAPMLAPPPLLAPVIEPPPPPPSMAPPASMGGAAMGAAPMMYAQPPAKRSAAPIIGAAVGGALLVGLVGFFALRGGGDDAKADASAKAAETAAPKSVETTPAKTADALAASTSTADAAKAGDEKAGDEKAGDEKAGDEKAGDEKSAGTTKTASGDTKTATGDTKALAGTGTTGTTKTTEPAKTEPKKEEPKKEEPAATAAGGDRPFDRGAASAQLGAAAGGAKGCGKPDGPKGSAKVQVTFSPSGKATQATVGPPFAGTSVGSCIAGSFRGLSVPPFTGSPVTVSKTVTIK